MRVRKLLFTILVFTSLFLFTGQTYADPLLDNEPTIEQSTQLVEEKMAEIEQIKERSLSIKEKTERLRQEVENLKGLIDKLNEQIEAKKAKAAEEARRAEQERQRIAAEKQRVAQLQNMFVEVSVYAPNSAGNTYAPGNCTWYVKDRRPDLPNMLGNANMWYTNAANAGFKVGSTPKKGAVATSTAGWLGHVAYVEGVTPDGQWVTISEMNYTGLYSISTRTVHYTEFLYIYSL